MCVQGAGFSAPGRALVFPPLGVALSASCLQGAGFSALPHLGTGHSCACLHANEGCDL